MPLRRSRKTQETETAYLRFAVERAPYLCGHVGLCGEYRGPDVQKSEYSPDSRNDKSP